MNIKCSLSIKIEENIYVQVDELLLICKIRLKNLDNIAVWHDSYNSPHLFIINKC